MIGLGGRISRNSRRYVGFCDAERVCTYPRLGFV